MDLTEKDCVEKALAYHKKGYNCSQAVACTFCGLMGLDESIVFQMMEGFGFGVSDSYGTCGAVTGRKTLIHSTFRYAGFEAEHLCKGQRIK